MSTNFTGGDPFTTPPPEPPTIIHTDFRKSGEDIAAGLNSGGIWNGFLKVILEGLPEAIAALLGILLAGIAEIVAYLAKIIVRGEENADDALADVARVMVKGMLGVDISKDALRRTKGESPRSPELDDIGSIVLTGMFEGFTDAGAGTLNPGDAGVKKVINSVVGMTVQGIVEGFAIDALSVHEFSKMAELPTELSKSIGFGRLTTRALRPLVDILVSTPYEWKINKQYRPTTLSPAQLVSQYLAGRVTRAELDETLARKGYSAAAINNLIDEGTPKLTASQLVHQYNRDYLSRDELNVRLKALGYSPSDIDALVVEGRQYLSLSDVEFLARNKYWTEEEALDEFRNQGYSQTVASQVLEVNRLQRLDTARQAVAASARALFLSGDMDANQYRSFQERAGLETDVIEMNMLSAGILVEGQRKKLSESDAEAAVKRGFWTMSEYQSFLRSLHFFENDILTKTLLLTDEIQLDAEATKKREDAEKARAAATAARQAAALARQAELEAKRLHPTLTLSQVAAAAVRGFLSIDQYTTFLRGEHYAEDDVQTLAAMVSADRQDYLSAQARRQKADEKLAATSLSTSQLERGVEVGALTMDVYRSTLLAQGVSDGDVNVLAKILQSTLDAQSAAAARHGEIGGQVASVGVSLAQMERAVRLGIRTLTEYRARLAALGYSTVDQELLSGLLEDQMAKDAAAEQLRQQAEAAAAVKKIPLGELRAAVKAGLRPIADYAQALRDLKYSPTDVDTMVQLLTSTIADDSDTRSRTTEIEDSAARLGIPLSDIERAVALGITDDSILAEAVAAAGGNSDDVDLITADVEQQAADIVKARVLEQEAFRQLSLDGQSMRTLKSGFRAGTITADSFRATLASAGFPAVSIAQLFDLATTENAFIVYAMNVRRFYDARATAPDVERAQREQRVREGRASIDSFRSWLAAQDVDPFDQATLVWLLSIEMV